MRTRAGEFHRHGLEAARLTTIVLPIPLVAVVHCVRDRARPLAVPRTPTYTCPSSWLVVQRHQNHKESRTQIASQQQEDESTSVRASQEYSTRQRIGDL